MIVLLDTVKTFLCVKENFRVKLWLKVEDDGSSAKNISEKKSPSRVCFPRSKTQPENKKKKKMLINLMKKKKNTRDIRKIYLRRCKIRYDKLKSI